MTALLPRYQAEAFRHQGRRGGAGFMVNRFGLATGRRMIYDGAAQRGHVVDRLGRYAKLQIVRTLSLSGKA